MKPSLPKNGLKAWTEFYESGQIIAYQEHEDTRGMTRSRVVEDKRMRELLRIEKEFKQLIRISEQAIEHYDNLAIATNSFELAKDSIKHRLGMKLERLK